MAWNDYITLDGKRYKVMEVLYEPTLNRQRTYQVGLTGKTLIQDFTTANRVPQWWNYRLKIFISDPEPTTDYGIWDDFLAAYNQNSVPFTEFDGVTAHQVGFPVPLIQIPRVHANIEGHCNGVFYTDVMLLKVHS